MPTEITSFSLQDFVAGLAAIRKREPSIEELVFQHEIAGDYGDALACYESMGKDAAKGGGGGGGSEDVLAGIVKYYLEIDRPHTASSLAKGLVQRHPETREKMAKYAVEAAWQLAQWDDIGGAADWAAAAPAKDWSVALANLLKCVHTEDRDGAVVSVGRSVARLMPFYQGVHCTTRYSTRTSWSSLEVKIFEHSTTFPINSK